MIDLVAKEVAITRFGLPGCLHVPIAAVDEAAISTYVGEIQRVLSGSRGRRAFLVHTKGPPPLDDRFPIWELDGSEILHQRHQVWVDVAYGRYRDAYRAAFPDEVIIGRVLSHAMNRRVAALKGFRFVRITPTTRAANSSSAFSEKWGVALHSSPAQIAFNRSRGAFIQYADLTELMLMLDIRLGGGVMDVVNEGQRLIRLPPGALPDR
jgi:hypothetical protein